jgi:crotonobetainyl-CoA:carnitine CoA-transferase CaiB-like acyl-CoA transferase
MADLGARVIKIEEPRGDPARGGRGLFFASQRGKEDLAVNLKDQRIQEIVRKLVGQADVVHHNLRAVAAEKLGIGPQALMALNPRLIYCHSSGYGNRGPWGHLPTFEPLHSAVCGLLHRTGGTGNPPLLYLTHMDIGCALSSTVCVLAALLEREKSGKGQYIEVPQIGTGFLAMSDVHAIEGEIFESFGLDHDQRGHAPTNSLYRTSDDWVLISCHSEREWSGVRDALDISPDSWLPYAQARRQSLDESGLGQQIALRIEKLLTIEAVQRLEAHGVPCAVPKSVDFERLPYNSMLKDFGIIVLEQHELSGSIWEYGQGIRFSSSSKIHRRPAPLLGSHSAAILQDLGVADQEVEALVADGAVVIAHHDGAVLGGVHD